MEKKIANPWLIVRELEFWASKKGKIHNRYPGEHTVDFYIILIIEFTLGVTFLVK